MDSMGPGVKGDMAGMSSMLLARYRGYAVIRPIPAERRPKVSQPPAIVGGISSSGMLSTEKSGFVFGFRFRRPDIRQVRSLEMLILRGPSSTVPMVYWVAMVRPSCLRQGRYSLSGFF